MQLKFESLLAGDSVRCCWTYHELGQVQSTGTVLNTLYNCNFQNEIFYDIRIMVQLLFIPESTEQEMSENQVQQNSWNS